MWNQFGKAYGVNFDEIAMKDLNDFACFNEFFTRKLKEGVRSIDNEFDIQKLSSPCDGTVLCLGDVVKAENGPCKYVMECIKGNTYPLDEFLFGQTSSDKDSNLTTDIVESAEKRGNKIV
jgi:phosphatidylserine decarboxylase